jgi:hypothetical protein
MTRSKISDVTNDLAASIRLAGVGAVVAALVAISATASFAQAAAPVGPTAASTLAAVPTTKLLAIGSFTGNRRAITTAVLD